MKKANILLIFMYPLISCAGSNCKIKKDLIQNNSCSTLDQFQPASQSNTLTFNHYCSARQEGYLKNYTFFEPSHSLGNHAKVLAVGEIMIGWFFLDEKDKKYATQKTESGVLFGQGISFSLDKLNLENFSNWSNDFFAVALQLVNHNTGQTVTGNFSQSFEQANSVSRPTDKPYQISNGQFRFLNLLEPENKNSGDRNVSQHLKFMDIFIPVQMIGTHALEHAFSVNFLIKNLKSNSTIVLKGPTLKNLGKYLAQIPISKPQTLGFWKSINPKQKGGVFDWISKSKKYGDCIYLRKQSKIIFDVKLRKQ